MNINYTLFSQRILKENLRKIIKENCEYETQIKETLKVEHNMVFEKQKEKKISFS